MTSTHAGAWEHLVAEISVLLAIQQVLKFNKITFFNEMILLFSSVVNYLWKESLSVGILHIKLDQKTIKLKALPVLYVYVYVKVCGKKQQYLELYTNKRTNGGFVCFQKEELECDI